MIESVYDRVVFISDFVIYFFIVFLNNNKTKSDIPYRILTGICPSPYKLAGICPSTVIFNFLTDQKQINFTVVTDVSLDHVLSKTDKNFHKAVWIIKIHRLKVELVDSEILVF
jgi:hypothetical protein